MVQQVENIGLTKYERLEKGKMALLKSIGKASKSKVAKSLAREVKNDENPRTQQNISVAGDLFHESMEFFRTGEMTFMEAIDDFYAAAKVIEDVDEDNK